MAESVTEFVIRSTRVITPEGVRPATILIQGETIVGLGAYEDTPADDVELRDVADLLVMPGIVDTHVHVNDPGRASWEGFDYATRAAAAGGVTTIVDMPLNSRPATTSLSGFGQKREAMRGKCLVDVGLWGGVIPGNAGELRSLYDAGVLGFKCFLVPSGVEEFPAVTEADLREAMPILAELGSPLLVHAELPGPIEDATLALANTEPRRYSTYLKSRPPAAEVQAITMMLRLAQEFDTHVHIVHVSSGESASLLRKAREVGVKVTAETCPHYLFFQADDVPDRRYEFKCAPPIREGRDRTMLWEALKMGTLDLIASDHSPAPPEMKNPPDANFFTAWGGIASLQMSLSATWTRARKRGHSPEDIARWMCEGPAKLAGLSHRKGAIARGYDADLVIWEPDAEFVVMPERLLHRHSSTPYAGRRLRGVVHETYVRGRRVYAEGVVDGEPNGSLVMRGGRMASTDTREQRISRQFTPEFLQAILPGEGEIT